MSPLPEMDDVDGKGDGIAMGPALYDADRGVDETFENKGCLPR